MELNSRIPSGTDREALGQHQVRDEAGESGQQAEAHGHRRGLWLHGRRRAATLMNLGYNVLSFRFQDSSPPRPLDRRAAAASTPPRITRTTATRFTGCLCDTVKGGDFRARESNVYRPAQIRSEHHRSMRRPGRCSPASTAGRLPTAVSAARKSREPSTPGQTGQQLLLGAYIRPWNARCKPDA